MNKYVFLVFLLSTAYCAQAVFTGSPAYSAPVYSNNAPKPVPRIITYNFLSEPDIINVFTTLFPNLRISNSSSKKIVMALGDKNDLDRFELFLKKIDTARPNIKYSTQLIEINSNELRKMGMDWQEYANQIKMSELKGIKQFFEQLSFLIKTGEAKILANPEITSIIEEEACIKVGERIPYALPVDYSSSKSGWQLQYIDAGIQLKIKGKIVSDNIINTHIFTAISNIKEWKATIGGEYPVLSSREVDLLCQIKDGETIILGGLTNSNQRTNVSKLPLVGDLPFVGQLFQVQTVENEETEVIFLLTPTIIRI
ncbi:MAG: type II and III secretion system protein [Candidatus Margulisbacteria bacterium]|nr:type II and III secretion system protein [Candidatus Margulisiibacteriota bacterium]